MIGKFLPAKPKIIKPITITTIPTKNRFFLPLNKRLKTGNSATATKPKAKFNVPIIAKLVASPKI